MLPALFLPYQIKDSINTFAEMHPSFSQSRQIRRIGHNKNQFVQALTSKDIFKKKKKIDKYVLRSETTTCTRFLHDALIVSFDSAEMARSSPGSLL